MGSSRKVFFCLLLIVAMIVAGVVLQLLLAHSRSQTAVSFEHISALKQVHVDTLSISDDLYQGVSAAPQQLQVHQNVMDKRLRQLNQKSGLLKTEAERNKAKNDSAELNNAWFALSKLLTKLQSVSPELVAQRETKNQLIVRSAEMLTKIDDLELALGRESRLKKSVSSALSYVDLMAEMSNIRSSLGILKSLVKEVSGLESEPAALSKSIAENVENVEASIEFLVEDSDRVVKSKLVELLEARDSFVMEFEKWSETLPIVSEAFLTADAIRQGAEDFSLKLNAKHRSGSKVGLMKWLPVMAYLLPILGAVFLVLGGRRYIQSTSSQLLISQNSTEVNAKSAKKAEKLEKRLGLVKDRKDQLKAELQVKSQKLKDVVDGASQHLNYRDELDDVKRRYDELEGELQDAKTERDKYKFEAAGHLSEFDALQNEFAQLTEQSSVLNKSIQSVEINAEELERENDALTGKLRQVEADLEQCRINEGKAVKEFNDAQKELAEFSSMSSESQVSIDSLESQVLELQELNEKLSQETQEAEKDVEKYQMDLLSQTQELESLRSEREELDANTREIQTLLESKSSDYESLNKERMQLGFELEARQQESDYLLSQLHDVEIDSSRRLEVEGESTTAMTTKINSILDMFADRWSGLMPLVSKVETATSNIHDLYLESDALEALSEEKVDYVTELQAKSERLLESLKKLSLGGKASADIVVETSALATQGMGSMLVINDSLESTAGTIEKMLSPLERLTENSQLMNSVVELLDSISEQAQSLDSNDGRTGLDITANDNVGSKYDLFENFRMATNKMTELVSEILSDVEGLAISIQIGMDDVQDSSVHAIAMGKLMKQVGASQSQLSRLIRALLTQSDFQADEVGNFAAQLEQVSDAGQERQGAKINSDAIENLKGLSLELKEIVERAGSD